MVDNGQNLEPCDLESEQRCEKITHGQALPLFRTSSPFLDLMTDWLIGRRTPS